MACEAHDCEAGRSLRATAARRGGVHRVHPMAIPGGTFCFYRIKSLGQFEWLSPKARSPDRVHFAERQLGVVAAAGQTVAVASVWPP